MAPFYLLMKDIKFKVKKVSMNSKEADVNMVKISANMVSELRQKTGAGMMACKKALEECAGDMQAAEEHLAKQGIRKAQKSAEKIAAEGAVFVTLDAATGVGAIVEVNCETDFVTKQDAFQQFVQQVAGLVLSSGETDVEKLSHMALSPTADTSVEEARIALIAKIGENIQVRRAVVMNAENGTQLGIYQHGVRIGVIVKLAGGNETLAKEIAMHIAAMKPEYASIEDVPAERYNKEKEIFMAQSESSGKPANIIEKMVEGRVQKFFAELCLTGQPFFKEPEKTVAEILKAHQAKVVSFERLVVGEGIEKKTTSFAEEVEAQVRGASK